MAANTLRVIEVPEGYKYLIDRYHYEMNTIRDNIGFMLSKHLSDETDDYLHSEQYHKLLESLQDAMMQCWYAELGVVIMLTSVEEIGHIQYSFTDQNYELHVWDR